LGASARIWSTGYVGLLAIKDARRTAGRSRVVVDTRPELLVLLTLLAQRLVSLSFLGQDVVQKGSAHVVYEQELQAGGHLWKVLVALYVDPDAVTMVVPTLLNILRAYPI
jgi:hypothetical protein